MKTLLRVLVLVLVAGGISLSQPASAQTSEDEESETIRRIAQSVVLIGMVQGDELIGQGSGTIIDPTGVIYTNAHVVEGTNDLIIFMLEDIQELPVAVYRATPTFVSDQLDFAIVEIDRDADGNPLDPSTLNLPFLQPALSPVDVGDQLRVFGYPTIGDGYMVVTSGEVVTIQNGTVNGGRMPVWYRTDTEFSAGNSGGLAVNVNNEYVGLPTWVVSEDYSAGKLGGVLPIVTINALLTGSTPMAEGGQSAEQGQAGQGQSDPGVAQPDPAQLVPFNVVNNGAVPVCYVLISPTTSTEWGEDRLGETEVIQPNAERIFEIPPDYYDLLLLDCQQEILADVRGIEIFEAMNYAFTGEAAAPPPQQTGPATGMEVSCGDNVNFSNGTEVILRGVPAGESYRITAIGLNGFDPVLAVLDTTTGEGNCIDDAPEAASFTLNLPSTGPVSGTQVSSQIFYTQETGVALADISIVVGGYNNAGGEFLLSIEGANIRPQDQGVDLLSVRLTPGLVASGVPVIAYMGGLEQGFDPLMFVAEPQTFAPLQLDDGTFVACDDAGTPECFGGTTPLTGSTITVPETTYTFTQTDSLLGVPVDGFDVSDGATLYLDIGLSSYQGASTGLYGVLLHLATG
jgi:hypothetical protein